MKSSRVALVAAAGLATIGLGAGCGSQDGADKASEQKVTASAEPSPATFNVPGTVALVSPDGFRSEGNFAGASCSGQSGYDDIRRGAQVVVRGADETELALGELGPGSLSGPRYQPGTFCKFSLLVFGVPMKGDLYSIEVSHRGEVSFKRDDLQSSGVNLTLG